MIFYSPYFIKKSLQEKALERCIGYIRGKVLDVGCGTKPYKKYLEKSCEYIGFDEIKELSPDVLGRATEMPFKDLSFDSVLCTEVLEHLPEPEKAIIEIKRVLKMRGYLFLTVPQEWCLHYEPYDYWRFTKYGIRYILERNAFEVVSIQRIGGIVSLVGQRTVDVSWQVIVNCLRPIFKARWSERIASVLCLPLSFTFYLLMIFGDRLDKRDALGWAVLAKCSKNLAEK